jgi:hypothetical protein
MKYITNGPMMFETDHSIQHIIHMMIDYHVKLNHMNILMSMMN